MRESVPLYLNGQDLTVFAVVDADLYPRIVALGPWYIHEARKCKYVRSWRSGHRREYLHVLVQRLRRRRKPSDAHVVRHLSGDTFDNRDCNLRWGTRSKNVRDAPYTEPAGASPPGGAADPGSGRGSP